MNAEFWTAARKIFGGALTQAQVNGIETILAASEGLPIGHRAYLLDRCPHRVPRIIAPTIDRDTPYSEASLACDSDPCLPRRIISRAETSESLVA